MPVIPRLLGGLAFAAGLLVAHGATFHVDPLRGDDAASGLSDVTAWRSLERARKVALSPGDRLLLIAGVRHRGSLQFDSLSGSADAPIIIGSYVRAGDNEQATAMIDGRNAAAAIRLRNCRQVRVENLVLTADGGTPQGEMRCGVLVEFDREGEYQGITLTRLLVKSVSFENPGHVRPEIDVKTPNGRARYGWGVRFIVDPAVKAVLRDIRVTDSVIERVDHTGLKFTAPADGIRDVSVENVRVSQTGGPGIQMSGVTGGRFARLSVDHSGSTSDTRNWGRGSGLWTWNTRDVVIERSRFTHANGPGDSAGVHIDYHCRNVVVQYNYSAHNAGGFCEILGDNHNCAYRYNISVNDGHRVKGREGAFQEGKLFWLSGYVGPGRKPTGPFNSYFYNNTLYVDATIEAKFTVAASAEGVLVANNIFHIVGRSRRVASDQSKAEQAETKTVPRAVVSHNLFLRTDTWPPGLGMSDPSPLVGDAAFLRPGGDHPADYLPGNRERVQDRGSVPTLLPGDTIGLTVGLAVTEDILGRPIRGAPDLGAIELP
ncbi:MAG: right-handed parallel beta-helix repeat-containing protein [Opitutaceae bacterium]|nr:right-handed parallel beta-helix repeat-containing protein [Opitutaceae bacterium]